MSRRIILLVAVLICLLFLVLTGVICFLSEPGKTLSAHTIRHAAKIGNLDTLKNLNEANPALVNAPDEYYGETALHIAANKDVAELLIAMGADVNANANNGTTPLHSAKSKEVAELLIAKGADVNAKDDEGATPLHWTNRVGVAEVLIAKGADINAKTNSGGVPLNSAISAGRKDIVKLLINNGAEIDFFAASSLGLIDRLKAFINENPALVHAVDISGWTALRRAAAWGQKEAAKLLIASGADVKAQDKDQRTALHEAAKKGHQNIVELLIANGMDVNTEDKDGRTPLHEAVETGHHSLAKLLISKDAKPDIFLASALGLTDKVEEFLKANPQLIYAKDKWGEEPLHKAAEWGHIKTVQFLIAKGADISAKSDSEEWTPLFWAIRSGHKDVAELLISKGANIEARNSYNWTQLQWAANRGRKDVVEFLIAKGANVNAKTDRGSTALHLAAGQCHKDIVKLLIDSGANINLRDVYGQSPLE